MLSNETKSKLRSGETVYGCFARYTDSCLIEVLAYHDWDFIVFDGEHGPIEPHHVIEMTRSCELRGVTPIARVPTNLPPVILRYMDTGVQGLHVPMVNSGEEAEQVVRSVKYQPRGIRGLAGVRASDYALTVPLGEYIEKANAETLVAVHIETVEAAENVEDIVKVEGVDVVFIGPSDLSQSLGYPGQVQHPKVLETVERLADAITASDAFFGLMVRDAEGARKWRDRGARYITIGLESVLSPALKGYLKEARA